MYSFIIVKNRWHYLYNILILKSLKFPWGQRDLFRACVRKLTVYWFSPPSIWLCGWSGSRTMTLQLGLSRSISKFRIIHCVNRISTLCFCMQTVQKQDQYKLELTMSHSYRLQKDAWKKHPWTPWGVTTITPPTATALHADGQLI